MTNEEKLEAIYKMTLENHEVLKTIRRQQYLATAGRLFYWLLVLGVVGGAYYYAKPFIEAFSSNYDKAGDALNQLLHLRGELPEGKALNELLEGLKKSANSGNVE